MNPGYQLACSMWVMTALSLALVILRLYTRIHVIKFVGAEDHMYAWTFVFLLLFTIFIQVSVHSGLGQDFWTLDPSLSSDAIFWTYVANTFAIAGNTTAKLSMGLFLLRVVQLRWHKISLWILIGVTGATSTTLIILLWNQTTPVKTSWDPIRTPGFFRIQILPVSVGLGVWSSACDFFFAVFPWLCIWSLQMLRREKFMLAAGMSLGVIAGACGIVRTVVLSRLDIMDYTLNFVPYFAWAAAEITVSMVCLGIPTLRPLYLKKRGRAAEYGQSRGSQLPHFTIIDRKIPEPASLRDSTSTHTTNPTWASNSSNPAISASVHEEETSQICGEPGPAAPTTAYIPGGRERRNTIDEIFEAHNQKKNAIWVRKEVQISRDDTAWPLRDEPLFTYI